MRITHFLGIDGDDKAMVTRLEGLGVKPVHG